MAPEELRIVPAAEADAPLVHTMITELADHLGLGHELVATEVDVRSALFGAVPTAEVVIALSDGRPAGFALYYGNYSTFRGRCGIHLEDLFVRAPFRKRGIGRALLAYLARLTIERGCRRLEWWVLSEDEKAVGFYEALGATAKGEWMVYRLSGEPLLTMATESPP